MKKNIIFFGIAIVLLGGLFFYIKSSNSPVAQVEPTNISFQLKIVNRKLVSGLPTLQVKEGDNVTIRITVDEPEELHLHGYDKSIDLEKDVEGSLTFTANLSGAFPYELEKSKTEIGTLEVFPK